MINILLIKKNPVESINIMNTINAIGSDFKIYKIIDNKDDLNIIYEYKTDIIIIEYKIFEEFKFNEISKISKIIKYMIIISDDNFNKSFNNKYFFCSLKDLSITINKIIKNIPNFNICDEKILKDKIINELKYLGYNFSYCGTKYLIEIIYYIYNNYNDFDEIYIQDIYPFISNKYNKSINTIKCDITRANSMMFIDCEESKIIKYLGCCSIPKSGSKLVIQSILQKIRLQYK
jgi:hypothetical protein